jgi:hypothetical protein
VRTDSVTSFLGRFGLGGGYPADPPKVEEIVAVMGAAGDAPTAGGCAG